jgi:hypothetical protein
MHEARHAAFAFWCGYTVLDVDLLRQRTLYLPPFNPDRLAFWWDEDRRQTQRHMTQLIGCIIAPYVGDVRPMDEGDATHAEMWRQTWERQLPERFGAPAPWPVIVASARRRVTLWLARPGVEPSLAMLAFLLRREVRMDVAAWQQFMQWPDLAPLRPRP